MIELLIKQGDQKRFPFAQISKHINIHYIMSPNLTHFMFREWGEDHY